MSYQHIGYYDPAGNPPGFLIPLFTSINNGSGENKPDYWYQEISSNFKIKKFTQFQSQDSKIFPIKPCDRIFNIDDDALFAFSFGNDLIITESREQLSHELQTRIDELTDFPFLRIEVMDFIGMIEGMEAAIEKASKCLGDHDMQIAKTWLDRELQILIRNKEKNFPSYLNMQKAVIRHLLTLFNLERDELGRLKEFCQLLNYQTLLVPNHIRNAAKVYSNSGYDILKNDIIYTALHFYCYFNSCLYGVSNPVSVKLLEHQATIFKKVLLRPKQPEKWPITPSNDLNSSYAKEIIDELSTDLEKTWVNLHDAYQQSVHIFPMTLSSKISVEILRYLKEDQTVFRQCSSSKYLLEFTGKQIEPWPLHKIRSYIENEFELSGEIDQLYQDDYSDIIVGNISEGIVRLYGSCTIDNIIDHIKSIFEPFQNDVLGSFDSLRIRIKKSLEKSQFIGMQENVWQLVNQKDKIQGENWISPEGEFRNRCPGELDTLLDIPLIEKVLIKKVLHFIGPHLPHPNVKVGQLADLIEAIIPDNMKYEIRTAISNNQQSKEIATIINKNSDRNKKVISELRIQREGSYLGKQFTNDLYLNNC